MNTTDKFTEWALVELMGHQKIAGLVSETTVAGAPMLRVDVPDKLGETRFTRFYGAGAVYCLSPVDKQIAIALAVQLDNRPVQRYQLANLAEQPERDWDRELPQPSMDD